MAVDYKKLMGLIGIKEDQLPSEDDAEIKYEDVAQKINEGLRSAVENDPEFIKKVNTAAVGRATGEVQRKLIKRFGLKFDNSEDEKNVDVVIDAAHKTASANANKTAQQLQDQLAERDEEIKNIAEKHTSELNATRGEVLNMKRGFQLNTTISQVLSKLNDPAKKKKLSSPVEVALPFMQQKLEELYFINYDDKGNRLSIHPHDNHELKVKDGTKDLTLEDAIASVAEKNNIVVPAVEVKKSFTFTPNGSGEESRTEKVTVSSEGLNKIAEKLEAAPTK